MRKALLYLMLAAATMVAASCHEDSDDIFTTADITITGGDTISISEIRATLRMTNLNTRQETQSTDFHGATCHVATMLRGSYAIVVEGVVRFTDRQGGELLRQFRASSDFIPLTQAGNNADSLELIFMDAL